MNKEFLIKCKGPIAKASIKDLETKREKNNANTMERENESINISM